MRTEIMPMLYLDNSRDVIDNKHSESVSPPIKDCLTPSTPPPVSAGLVFHHPQSQPHHNFSYSMAPSPASGSGGPPPQQPHDGVAPAANNGTTSEHDFQSPAPVFGVQMNYEQARRQTFAGRWPLTYLDTNLLAQTGFYYVGPHDTVKCHFCQIEIGSWLTDDNELTEHQRWSSNCSLLRRRPTNNVPLDAAALDRILPPVSIDVCGRGGVDVRYNTISEGSFDVQPALVAPSAAPSIEPAHVPLVTPSPPYDIRPGQPGDTLPYVALHSAPTSSIRHPDHPEYAIESARLRSFDDWPKTMKQKPKELSDAGFFYTMKGDRVKCFCCGGGLRDWDENDVPWEQHALWFDKCQYLQLIKGPEYVAEVKRKADAAAAAASADEAPTPNGQPEGKAPAVGDQRPEPVECATLTGAADDANGSASRPCDSKLCKICYSCEYNTTFQPCGHVVACAKCASSVTKCPMCRKPFDSIFRVYFS